jgi:hypothetical protein
MDWDINEGAPPPGNGQLCAGDIVCLRRGASWWEVAVLASADRLGMCHGVVRAIGVIASMQGPRLRYRDVVSFAARHAFLARATRPVLRVI